MRQSRLTTSILLVALCVGCGQKTQPSPTKSVSTGNSVEEKEAGTKSGQDVLDLNGEPVDPFAKQVSARVFVFITTDCPIANRYAPTLKRMANEFADRDVAFFFVYPNVDDTAEKVRLHREEYNLTSAALLDPHHILVDRTQATVTPEAAVFDSQKTLAYCGRIDDWYVDFGKNRPEPTTHNLRDAIEAVLAGEPVPEKRVKAVGCYIADGK